MSSTELGTRTRNPGGTGLGLEMGAHQLRHGIKRPRGMHEITKGESVEEGRGQLGRREPHLVPLKFQHLEVGWGRPWERDGGGVEGAEGGNQASGVAPTSREGCV